ncbi:hypothetical protein JJE66_33770 [Bradyrhizobium diazoefficiens]|uniref:hypothetical protein n=1 Tax=Bradyrhizobium diazoefficiens TaxID=1355477 RepID=UPI00190AF95B|nr:hypothetical protein [Bradyrhizobium diazoefficiens]MBK3666177.1 hypothetical protein [Bradyrhizobium diazoefficiens]
MGNVTFNNPMTGRIFLVAKSGITNESEIKASYASVSYPDGTPMLYTTLKLALASCVASRGDTIVLAPGHTETITAAAGSGVTVAGVRVVGLGSGTLVPTFTFTTAVGASFDVTAANVWIENVNFVCGIDNQTAMVNVTASDVKFQNCVFTTNTATIGAALGILTAATSDRLVVNQCRFLGTATNSGTTTTAQVQYEGAVDIVIQNNYFAGKMTQSILNTATVLRGLIFNNNFVIATGTKAIAVAAASTPFISSNNINVPSGTAPVVAAAGFVANNKYSAAAGVTAGAASTF